MGRDRAVYMREYRARVKAEDSADTASLEASADRNKDRPFTSFARLEDLTRIAELEEEVRHLKAELAQRPTPYEKAVEAVVAAELGFNTRPFTPVPKVKRPVRSPR